MDGRAFIERINMHCVIGSHVPSMMCLLVDYTCYFLLTYVCRLLSMFFKEIKHFDNHVRQLYTKSTYLVDDESWPPFTPNKFVSLLLIRHLEKQLDAKVPAVSTIVKTGSTNANSEKSFTTSDISKIFQYGGEVEAHNKVILILGVPGIGKTILSREISYQWADKRLLLEKQIVLMLFLRDPNIHKVQVLKDLVHYFYGFSEDSIEISDTCAKYLFEMGGINVTIILDGLDEISNEVIDNTYIKLLLDRKALPCCRIVVTSRPVESAKFQAKADTEVEILGFNEECITNFITNELKEDKQKKLIDYLKQNENLYHLCYIPFIISVLVCIVKEYDKLPANQVEVYERFVIFTISRFLQKFEHLNYPLSTFDEIPVKYKSYLFELCKYAFSALEIDQVVFTRKDVIKTSPKFTEAPETWYGLGLLKTVKYFKITEKSDCITYNFLHKSIQEFLAALYITKLTQEKQLVFIKKYFFLEKYLNMWIMYIGLSKDLFSFWHFLSENTSWLWSKCFGINGISNKILDSKICCLYLFHCFSELGDESMCNLVGTLFQSGKLDLSCCTLSLSDINTMIYILERSTTTQWNELNLSHCNIDDIRFQHLSKRLSALNRKVYFDEMDIDNNMLSLDSVQYLANLLMQCKIQKLYASNNSITNDNTTIAYFVIEYAFIAEALANPLLIMVNDHEKAIFYDTENKVIIQYLNSRLKITDLYCINCQVNDEVIEQLTAKVMKHKMIMNLCFWNSNISTEYLNRVLSIMLQGNLHHFLLVHEAIKDDTDVAFMLPAFIHFTFIFITKISVILCYTSSLHINLLIFSNPMLQEMNQIQTVCLSNCVLSDETVEMFIQLFNQCNKISTLSLLNNTINAYNLIQLIHSIKPKRLLRKVFLHQNNMTENDIYLLGNLFKNIQLILMNDEVLRAYNCSGEQLKYPGQTSQTFLSLTMLMMQYCEINDHNLDSLNKLFRHNICINTVTVSHCLISKQTANKLLQYISVINTLRKLHLTGNKLRLTEEAAKALTSIIVSNRELEELYLGNNQLHLGITKLAVALKNISSLKVLDLANNNITELAADELSAAIRANNSLEKLCLNGNHLGSSTVMIVNALIEISTLKELDLNDNKNKSGELAPTISSIITKNRSIEVLALRDNSLNDVGVIKIAQSLCKCSKLKVLDLQSNNITEEAAEALASIISSNTELEELYLGNNLLQLGVIKISTALKDISSLKLLDLDNNNIPEQAADELSVVIKANRLLETLSLTLSWPDFPQLFAVYRKTILLIDQSNHLHSYYI